MRFFAVTGATVLAMGIAGKVVREGGLKLVYDAERYAKSSGRFAEKFENNLHSYKKIQAILDEMQGVTRQVVDVSERDSLVIKDKASGRFLSNTKTTVVDDFNNRIGNETLGKWGYREEIQQRLVSQARRLPYELPGLYIAQKAVIDPVMGTNKERKKVNWKNPFDVVGDFAYQSVKNVAANILPFEAANAAGKTGFRSLMRTFNDPNAGLGVQTVKELLSQVGANSVDILNKTMRFSQGSMGAFSSMVEDAQNNKVGYRELLKRLSTNNVSAVRNSNAGFARKVFSGAKNPDNLTNILDAMPGPFKGMGTALKGVGENFRSNKRIYDLYQEVISGTKSLASVRKTASQQEYAGLLAFMNKGGGSRVEQFATQAYHLGSFNLGKGMNENTHVNFFQIRHEQEYRKVLAEQLQAVGVPTEASHAVVRVNGRVSPVPGAKAPFPGGDNLMERFSLLTQRFHGDRVDMHSSQNSWWEQVKTTFNKHQILDKTTADKLSFDLFEKSVGRADAIVGSRHFQDAFKLSVQKEWNLIRGSMIPDALHSSIPGMAKPFEAFNGSLLNNQKDFLIKRTAQRLGISLVDDTGKHLPMSSIQKAISDHGFDSANLSRMRGFLISQKDIANPHKIGNLFGIKAMSIKDAFANNYFSANPLGVQKEIQSLIDTQTHSPLVGRGGNINLGFSAETRNDLRMSGLYRTSNGSVIDLGRVARTATQGFERFVENYQVPLLKFNPFKMLGSSSFKTWRNTPPIMFASGESKQLFPMAGGNQFRKPDFYMWMKNSASKTKGRVVGIESSLAGNPTFRVLGDNYRPFIDTKNSMMSKFARIWSGNTGTPRAAMYGRELRDGQLVDEPGSGRWNKWKRKFDIATDQENNFIGGKNSAVSRWWKALRRKPEAYQNPYLAAEGLSDPAFRPSGMTQHMSEGVSRLRNNLRDAGFSKKLIQRSIDSNGFFAQLNIEGVNPAGIAKSMLPTNIERIMKADEAVIKASNPKNLEQLRSIQSPIKSQLRQANKYGGLNSNFYDLNVSSSLSGTVSTRIDQLTGSVIDYAILRQDLMGIKPFSQSIADLLGEVEQMASKGMISGAEKSEARAAVLSLKMDNVFKGVSRNQSLLSQNTEAISELLKYPEARSILGEIGNYSLGDEGRFGIFKPKIRKFFSDVPYSPANEINPLGSDPFFVPTFREAFAKNPLKAIQGALGISAKSEAISGGAMPITHMVTRLDRYFQTFGLGLDTQSYKNPMDLYARGMIGKRVLPIFAAGTSALAIDRTLGGIVNKRDQEGNRVYSPLVLGSLASGVAKGQQLTAGLIPGGQTYQEKKEELEQGEVPVRQGRFWFLGNTPFKGGRIQYFRPSWYRRMKAGASFTPEMHETPVERLLYGYDFSPLRPLDPYRREREDYSSRPYPVTGDYFTGPWGPLTPALNATLGKVLKPTRKMHKEEMRYGLQQYLPVGESGAYMSASPVTGTPSRYSGVLATQSIEGINNAYTQAGYMQGGAPSSAPFYSSLGFAPPRGRASSQVRQMATGIASNYSNMRYQAQGMPSPFGVSQTYGGRGSGGYSPVPFGIPAAPGRMQPRILASEEPRVYGTTAMNMRRLGYQSQELFGIYGFGAASMREAFGMGTKDFTPNAAVLEPASRGYSASRSFWNLNLGGLGDLPLPIEGKFSNFELSEVVRRFVPKEPSGINYINPIANEMGRKYPWLPGNSYPLAPVKMGDPYNSVPEAEIRLPGTGYARTHQLYSDQYGKLGLANIHDILGDVAPWSQEYKSVDKLIQSQNLTGSAMSKVQQTRAQVEAMRYKNEFTPYEYKYQNAEQMSKHPISYAFGRAKEWIAHRDTYLNTKFMPTRTAIEDWERNNVYGATFPKWESPVESFIKPSMWKSTQRNPIAATLAGGTLGSLFGSSGASRALGSIVGGALGLGSSLYGKGYQAVSGKRYMPTERRKQVALEEYTDILDYTRSIVNASRAAQSGNNDAAQFFMEQSKKTMYGADLNSTPEQLAMSVPKRKREHFRAMMYAPEQERGRILSTAGRLERRMFEAAWNMPVEQKPDLTEYFKKHELPSPESDIWSPVMSMDNVKIKVGESMGLDMSQMGYYPQQLKEASLVNPSYPDFFRKSGGSSIRSQIQRLIYSSGGRGSVSQMPSPFGGTRTQLNAGVF
jgi:hypothetical protein